MSKYGRLTCFHAAAELFNTAVTGLYVELSVSTQITTRSCFTAGTEGIAGFFLDMQCELMFCRLFCALFQRFLWKLFWIATGSSDLEPAEHLRKVLDWRVRSFSSSKHSIIFLKKSYHPSTVSSSLKCVQTRRLLFPSGLFWQNLVPPVVPLHRCSSFLLFLGWQTSLITHIILSACRGECFNVASFSFFLFARFVSSLLSSLTHLSTFRYSRGPARLDDGAPGLVA